jgi:hypothetical protein
MSLVQVLVVGSVVRVQGLTSAGAAHYNDQLAEVTAPATGAGAGTTTTTGGTGERVGVRLLEGPFR